MRQVVETDVPGLVCDLVLGLFHPQTLVEAKVEPVALGIDRPDTPRCPVGHDLPLAVPGEHLDLELADVQKAPDREHVGGSAATHLHRGQLVSGRRPVIVVPVERGDGSRVIEGVHVPHSGDTEPRQC